jgi:hypothetical protein
MAYRLGNRRRIATGKANVFGIWSGAPPFVPQRKTRSLWLLAQIVAATGIQPIMSADAKQKPDGPVLASDVAARDVQAATSPASRIARAERKSWRFAGGGSRAEGKRRRGKGKVFRWLSVSRKPAVSNFPPM